MPQKTRATQPVKKLDKMWAEEVKKCKVLVAEHYSIKLRISQAAIKLCYRSDGTPRPKEYSVKRFAEDIGLKYTTLKEWVNLTRTVWEKLDDENKNPETFTIYQARTIRKTVGSKATRKEVNNMYKHIHSSGGKDFMKFRKYIDTLQSIKINAMSKEKMKGASAAQRRAIKSLCQEIVEYL